MPKPTLTTCDGCGATISTDTETCPSCGTRRFTALKKFNAVVGLTFLVFMISVLYHIPQSPECTWLCG